MCGRFVRALIAADYAAWLDAGLRDDLAPSYNIAPTQDILAARLEEQGARELVALRWGLVPAWSRGPDNRYSMINARAESVAGKPAYRQAFKRRRCLIPADGFYEWQRRAGGKQPYYIHLAGGGPFAMAGLWERWRGEDDSVIESCTIITTTANERVAELHERMPVILDPADHARWLDPAQQAEALAALLRPCPADGIIAYPVSTRVNRPVNNDPECLQPLG